MQVKDRASIYGLHVSLGDDWMETRGISWDGQLITLGVKRDTGPVQLFYRRLNGPWIPGSQRQSYNDVSLRDLGQELDRMIAEIHRGTFVPEDHFLALAQEKMGDFARF